MDLVSVQLGHGIPDGLYDVQTGHGYTYPSHVWPSIRDSDRGFQTQPQGQGVDSTVRQSDQSRNTKRHSQMENTNNADCADWNTDGEDSKTFETSSNDQNSQKQSQVSATLKWLTENYERAEGVCLPRCVLYTHYLDFCKKMKFTPAGAATFGKIIRQKFPKLTTRRLGTRGQSKYHYYGIGIKETSIYYHSVYSGKGLTRFSGIKIKTEGSNRKYSLSSKTGTLLPEFPDSNNFILPENMDKEKMQTFIMMYRTHCQRILDTIISANFDEVQNFLLHFWQGMPEHLTDLLEFDLVVDIVGLCDSILYKVLIDVLIPSTIQDLPESLGTEIKLFTKRLPYWLSNSLENVPESLRQKKIEVVKSFIQSIRRQISFVHLAQTARTVLLNHDTINQMNEDVADINFIEICCRASFIEPSTTSKFKETILDFFDEFQNLLSKQAPIEAYTEWLDNIIDKCVLQSKKESSYKFKDRASFFLLQWAIFGSLLMRDLTLHSASSFGSFHLIHMMLDEYVFLVMETQHDLNKEEILQRNVQCHMKNAEEINMSAKIRTPSNKGHLQNSPKTRKRKLSEGHYDSGDDADISRSTDENRLTVAESYTPVNGTAFSRPPPSHNRELASYPYVEDSRPVVSHATLPLSPLKHYPSLNSGPYDRPTYLPQYGLNSYNDLMNGGNSFSSSRIPSYADTHSQSFNSAPFSNNVSQTMGTYLSDTRQHSTVHDPYHYSYNKFHPTYDTYNKSIIRGGPYQEAFNRSAFDTSRSYYRSAHDNLHAVASHLSVGGFNNTYMDIAQPGTQYARQDPVLYQDDLYQSAMTSSFPAFGKSYLTASFR